MILTKPRSPVTALLFLAFLAVSARTAAQDRVVCDAGPPPSGWMTVSYGAACDSSGTLSRTIHEVGSLPPGSTLAVCGNDIPPSGWATVSMGDSCARQGRMTFYRRTIQNLNGMPVGSTATVCGPGPVPIGWAVTATGGACASIGGASFSSRTITRRF